MKCTRCEAYLNPYINKAEFSGNPNAELLFLGEMYGKTELIEKKAFVGDAGKKLVELLGLINIDREEVAITNSLKCYLEGNATPNKKQLDACFIHLYNEVLSIKPKLVVALGATAFYQSTGISKDYFSEHLGKVIYSDRLNCNVYITYHPAACLYDPKKWEILVEHFREIPFLLNRDRVKIRHYNYVYVQTTEDFYKHFNRLKKAKFLYLDTETTGLNPYYNDITLIQLGDGVEPIIVIDACILEDIKEDLKFLLETKPIIGQGFEFDAKFLAVKLNIFIKNWYFDTCIAEFVISGMKNNDLTFLTAKYVPESSGYDFEIKQAGGFHRMLDRKKALQYAADDIGVLYKIHKKQLRYLKKHNQWYLFHNIIMPNNKVLTKMSLHGIEYDIDKLMALDKRYEKKANKAFKKISELKSIKACEQHFKKKFNPRSPKQLKWLLLEYYKLPVIKTTKKGNPSLGKKELSKYAKEHKNEYCIAMEQYRVYESLRANQLSGVLQYLVDNRAHTEYSLHATTTGRSASYNPNLLNLQPEVKKCVIPKIPKVKEKCYFVKADMSQLEVRVASVIYYDPLMIEFCNSGKDFHSLVAARVTGKKYKEFNAEINNGNPDYAFKRKVAKCVPGATRVATNRGMIRIEELIDRKKTNKYAIDKKIPYYAATPGNPTKIIEYYSGNRDITITIESEDGYEIEASPEHKILVLNNNEIQWKTFDSITQNDYIAVSLGARLWNSHFAIPKIKDKKKVTCHIPWQPQKINKLDIARFIGLFLAEGSCVDDAVSVGVSGGDIFERDVSDLFHRIFYDRHVQKNIRTYPDKDWEPMYSYVVSSVDCAEWLKLLEINKTAEFKKIPECVFSWPKRYQVELLKWYFEGDGTIKKNGRMFSISCTSKSKQLIKDIQLLLANFGIRSRIHKEKRKWRDDILYFYILDVKTTNSINIFMNEIGFVTEKKHNRYTSTTKFEKDYEFIPISVDYLKKLDKYVVSGYYRDRYRECTRKTKPVKLSKTRLNDILSAIDFNSLIADFFNIENAFEILHIINNLEKISKMRVSWQKVKNIKYNNEIKDLYDISVNYPHQVVYNGIICHQSTTFGLLYQEGPDGLAYNLGISRSKAEKFIEEYFEQFPHLKEKIEEVKQHLIKYGYVDNYFGLRRRWEYHSEENHNMLREGVNFPIQSCAWQLCQMAMNDIDDATEERNLKSRLVMQIHDENILEVPESELEIIKTIVPEIMSAVNKPFPVLNEVKLSADLKVVETLGG